MYAGIIKAMVTILTPLAMKAFRVIQENTNEEGSRQSDIGSSHPDIITKNETVENAVINSGAQRQIPIMVSWPVTRIPIRITSKFGWRKLPNGVKGFHAGVDFQTWDSNRAVLAVEDSYVVKVVQVDKEHPERFRYNEKTKTWDEVAPKGRAWTPYIELIGVHSKNKYVYKHVKAGVLVGKQVSAGEAIGKAGNYGYSMGEHLHFEVYDYIEKTGKYSAAIDGIKYLQQVLQLRGEVLFGKTTEAAIKQKEKDA